MRRSTVMLLARFTVVVVCFYAVIADAKSASAPASLCKATEFVVFDCDLSQKAVSICVEPQGPVVYRYGRPGRVELELSNLHYAFVGFGGGGEDQVIAENSTYQYIVYVGTYRTNYGPSGRHDPQFQAGLLVQRAGKIVSTQLCTETDATFETKLQDLLPETQAVFHLVHFKSMPHE